MYVWVEWEGGGRNEHTQGLRSGSTVKPLSLCFFLSGSKSSLVYMIILMPTQIHEIRPPTNMLHADTPPSSIPPTHCRWHFCWGTTCVLFTLGNRWTSCYAIHSTYMAFLLGNYLHPVYFRKQVHLLLCQSRNLCQRDLPVSIQHSIWKK